MNELALFAGAGGGLLGSRLLGFRLVCAVERDPFCTKLLVSRMDEGHLDKAPIWDDVHTFDGRQWAGVVDVVTAGFPCQPFSLAGDRKGEEDSRNMWPDTIRIIRESKAPFAFLENVPGLLCSGYFGFVLKDLAEAGYDARWCVLGADDVGAPHRRKRLWILANSTRHRRSKMPVWQPRQSCQPQPQVLVPRQGEEQKATPLGHAGRPGLEEREGVRNDYAEEQPTPVGTGWWASEPGMGRMVDGVPDRVDRIKAIGNAQVPLVAKTAWELLNSNL